MTIVIALIVALYLLFGAFLAGAMFEDDWDDPVVFCFVLIWPLFVVAALLVLAFRFPYNLGKQFVKSIRKKRNTNNDKDRTYYYSKSTANDIRY